LARSRRAESCKRQAEKDLIVNIMAKKVTIFPYAKLNYIWTAAGTAGMWCLQSRYMLSQFFPTILGLQHPVDGKCNLRHQWGVHNWWQLKICDFNDILKNALARGTPEYCKWHPSVPRRPGGNHWS